MLLLRKTFWFSLLFNMLCTVYLYHIYPALNIPHFCKWMFNIPTENPIMRFLPGGDGKLCLYLICYTIWIWWISFTAILMIKMTCICKSEKPITILFSVHTELIVFMWLQWNGKQAFHKKNFSNVMGQYFIILCIYRFYALWLFKWPLVKINHMFATMWRPTCGIRLFLSGSGSSFKKPTAIYIYIPQRTE